VGRADSRYQAGNWFPHQFFINGQRHHRASSPLSGFANMQGELSMSDHAQFRMAGNDISPDDVQDGVEELSLDKWLDFRAGVVGVDGQTVTLSRRPHGLMNQPDLRYRFENVRSAGFPRKVHGLSAAEKAPFTIIRWRMKAPIAWWQLLHISRR
jgi:hypothetical protein